MIRTGIYSNPKGELVKMVIGATKCAFNAVSIMIHRALGFQPTLEETILFSEDSNAPKPKIEDNSAKKPYPPNP